jgi:hypothetical protein
MRSRLILLDLLKQKGNLLSADGCSLSPISLPWLSWLRSQGSQADFMK